MEYELYHYGIPGMKWGVRRYRRKLAKLTGRDRRDISDKEAKQFKRDVNYLKTLRDNKWDSGGIRFDNLRGRMEFQKKMTSKKGEAYVRAVFKTAKMNTTTAAITNEAADKGRYLMRLAMTKLTTKKKQG